MKPLSDSQTAIYRQTFQQRLARQYQMREEWRQKALTAIMPVIPTTAAIIPSLKAVYLFGSIIQPGRFRQDSDIDVAVVGATAADYFAFWQKLEHALPNWTIDLRDADDGTYFAKRVLETGMLIYERTHSSTPG